MGYQLGITEEAKGKAVKTKQINLEGKIVPDKPKKNVCPLTTSICIGEQCVIHADLYGLCGMAVAIVEVHNIAKKLGVEYRV